ncbi:MAG TPA: type II toxin-antitoxin system Phd/YefM family antitoxin [Ramlibacter sp.]|uniref:type II toxin-antitoxin system Phd/YefM family antitoxin n=1 Tax=Ramlibacter sp. TaxID=1917967 RepID=UPI002D10B83B|nr:type II toxin-antitoxin system Phd/YefM family antitoxin [Ramlibacter sp.]HVZ46704.1 type II toxin-antitoxin system Phd/YefM family antitoxin [Ramlibacter sp.]
MRYSTQVKPISYVKANAAQVIQQLAQTRQPLLITQNGQAAAVMQDLASYETDQEALSLLKIIALGRRQVEQGRVYTVKQALAAVRGRRKK